MNLPRILLLWLKRYGQHPLNFGSYPRKNLFRHFCCPHVERHVPITCRKEQYRDYYMDHGCHRSSFIFTMSSLYYPDKRRNFPGRFYFFAYHRNIIFLVGRKSFTSLFYYTKENINVVLVFCFLLVFNLKGGKKKCL
jgi:hypothetical protein